MVFNSSLLNEWMNESNTSNNKDQHHKDKTYHLRQNEGQDRLTPDQRWGPEKSNGEN